MSIERNKVVSRKELAYLGDAVETFETEKRTAKAEALRKATLQVAAMRADLAKMIWDSVNVNGATIADVSAVSGYSRATVYRFLDEHVENTGGNPNALLEAVQESQMQKRFTYRGVGSEGEILVYDTRENVNSSVYVEAWKNEWYYQEVGRQSSKEWAKHPELDLLVGMIEAGSFVPEDGVRLLAPNIRERMRGVLNVSQHAKKTLDNGDVSGSVDDIPQTFEISWE